jgi:hypothetical protein
MLIPVPTSLIPLAEKDFKKVNNITWHILYEIFSFREELRILIYIENNIIFESVLFFRNYISIKS